MTVTTRCRWCWRDTRGLRAADVIDLSIGTHREYGHRVCAVRRIMDHLEANR